MGKAMARAKTQYSVFGASLLLFLLLGTCFALAQETGRVQFNGRTVILNDDNTWQYAEEEKVVAPEPTNCVKMTSKILPASVCLDDKLWQIGEPSSAAEFSFKTKDDKLFLLVITEKDEIAFDAYEKAIVANAQKAAGLNPVEIVSKERINALNLEWGRMVYIANLDGLKIEYENFFTTIKGKGSVQYVFYSTVDDYAGLSKKINDVITKISVN